MNALLLCAGKGTRMQPLASSVPKVMLPVGGEPLIGRTLRWLREYGVEQTIINLHHLPQAIIDYVGDGLDWDMRVSFSYEEVLRGTAGALWPVREKLQGPFLVVYGDKLYGFDLSTLVRTHTSSVWMTMAVHHTDRPHGAGLAAINSKGIVTRYQEKPEEVFSEWANAGVYVCNPEVLGIIPDGYCDWGYDMLPLLVPQGVVKAVPIEGLAMDIGTPERYMRAQELTR